MVTAHILLFVLSTTIAFFVLLGIWSGATTNRTQTPAPDWFEGVFLAFVSLIVMLGWFGVILASIGLFGLGNLSICLLVGIAIAIAVWRYSPIKHISFSPIKTYELILLGVLVGCSIIYFRPHEYVMGGADAGSYVNTAASLVRTGKYLTTDDWTQLLYANRASALREQPPAFQTRYLQFVGWYIEDQQPHRVIPQFFPFHPVLLAIGIALAGLEGGLLVTPLWGVIGIAACYLLGRKLFGPRVALAASIFLAITPTQIFFARYPTAEPLTLLLVFAGLYGFQTIWQDSTAGSGWGWFAGIALGAALLTRIDLPLLVAIILLATLTIPLRGKWTSSWTSFAVTFGSLIVHSILSAWFLNRPYTWNTYSSVWNILTRGIPPVIAAAGLGLPLILALALYVWSRKVRTEALADTMSRRIRQYECLLRHMGAALVIALSGYAFFLRPVLEPAGAYSHWLTGNEVLVLNNLNWVRLGWYLTPLGLLLCTVGLALILEREAPAQLWPFVAIGFLTTVQLVYRSFIPSYHIYMMRRYVPMVIPTLMLYAAYAIECFWQMRHERPRRGRAHSIAAYAIECFWQMRRHWLYRLASVALALALSGGVIYQSRFVLPQRDYRGVLAQLSDLNAHLVPEAVLIITSPPASQFPDYFGVPLHFIFGHDIVVIHSATEGLAPLVQQVMQYAKVQGRSLQLVSIDPIPTELQELVSLSPRVMVPIRTQMLRNTFDAFPAEQQNLYWGVEIYDVSSPSNARPPYTKESFTVDIGELDTAFIRSGFYDKEDIPGQPTMRWTSGEALIEIPVTAGSPITVEIRAMIYRPEKVAATPVTVELDSRKLGEFIPEQTWSTFTFTSAPTAEGNASSLVRLLVDSFNPSLLQISGDKRDLGFLIDWIRISQ